MKSSEINLFLSLSLLLFFFFFFFLHPVSSTCVPRTDHITLSNQTSPAFLISTSSFSDDSSSSPSSTSEPQAPNGKASAVSSASILKTLSDLCSKTEYKDVCISSVESVLPTSGSLDATSLLYLQLDAIKAKYQAAQDKVTKLINDPKTSEDTKGMLQVCQETYDTAMDNIEDARNSLRIQDGPTLGSNLSALLDEAYTCEDAFDESDATSPIKPEDAEIEKIGATIVTMGTVAVPSDHP